MCTHINTVVVEIWDLTRALDEIMHVDDKEECARLSHQKRSQHIIQILHVFERSERSLCFVGLDLFYYFINMNE